MTSHSSSDAPRALPGSMRAVQLVAPGLPVSLQHIPVPPCGPDEVLVRVRAAGICHSDVHYRAGRSHVEPLPLTLGHEVAGEVVACGDAVTTHTVGDRVCLHYLVTCGRCESCAAGHEQFCTTGRMLGHFTDGGWAEYLAVPARNAVPLPPTVSYEHAAVMMCSSATSLHALRKGRLIAGERVLVVGAGGLGLSAIQLAYALGAREVIAVDRDEAKLAVAEQLGATPVSAAGVEVDQVVRQVRELTRGVGLEVALELVGRPDTMQMALQSLAPFGRAVIVGLCDAPLAVNTYRDLIGREAELIGSNDHLLSELHELLRFAESGELDLTNIVTHVVPLEAGAINNVLDALEQFAAPARTVIRP